MSDEIASLCPKLSYTQRLYGFCICFFLGFVLSLGSFMNFIELLQGNPVPFVVMYSLGNIVALCSTMFLCGPKSQWKSMSKEGRYENECGEAKRNLLTRSGETNNEQNDEERSDG